MNKMIAIAALAVTLVGCGLDQNVVEMNKCACARQQGEVTYTTTSDGTVLSVRCIIDGISYRVGENTGKMYEGIKVK